MTDTDTEITTLGKCPTCQTILRRYVQTDGDVIGRATDIPSSSDLSVCTACGEALIVRNGIRLASSRDLEHRGEILDVLRITLSRLRAKAGRVRQ